MPPVVVAIAGAAVTAATTAGLFGLGTVLFGTVTVGLALSSVIAIGGALWQANQMKKAASAHGQQALRGGVVATAPHFRFLYGKIEVEGIRVFRHVAGKVRYDAYIMNSRPSLGGFAFKLNDTRIELLSDGSNDVYDMDKGAGVSTSPWNGHVKLWASVGDHTKPPQQFLDELSDDAFSATDIGLGMTMLWVRSDYGANDSAQSRWNGKIPTFKVDGYWSRLYDPRNPSHVLDDPDTHDWSATPALVTLDLLLNKRALARPHGSIDFANFGAGADKEEQSYIRADGEWEAWYECHGVIEMQTREYDLLSPVLQSGAARLVKVGGIHQYIPGFYEHSGVTLTDPVGESLEYSEEDRFSTVPGGIETRFISERKGWVETTLPVLWSEDALEGGASAGRIEPLSLGMVSSATQAMRLQQAYLRGRVGQRKLTATFGPEAERLSPGDIITVATPEMPVINGIYEVQDKTSEFTPLKAGGFALSHGMVLVGQPEDQFAFVQADEQDYEEGTVDPVPRPEILPVSNLTVQRSGDNLVFEFDESPSPSNEFYRVRGITNIVYNVLTFDSIAPGEHRTVSVPVPPEHDGQGRRYIVQAYAPFGSSENNPEVTI